MTLAWRSALPPSVDPDQAPQEPTYEVFRFDRKEPGRRHRHIDRFDVIRCFGLESGIDNGPDSDIDLPEKLLAAASELAALTRWMNDRQGGIFATGDHDCLGASMCSRIVRVGTMRLWTNARGVPPLEGEDRIDTNRPAAPRARSRR